MRLFYSSTGLTECLWGGRAAVSDRPSRSTGHRRSLRSSPTRPSSIWASRKLFMSLPLFVASPEVAAPGADKFNIAYFFLAAILAFSMLVACFRFLDCPAPFFDFFFLLEAKLSERERERGGSAAYVWLPVASVLEEGSSRAVFAGPSSALVFKGGESELLYLKKIL